MEKNEKSIETPQFFIKGNIMTWEGNMLQLSNVSSISTTGLEQLPFPKWTLIVFLAGLFLFSVSWIVALVCIAVGGLCIYYWYTQNQKRQSTINLVIFMNSGISFQFLFRDKPFLKKY